MADIVTHPINTSTLRINNKEYFAVNVSKVIVGVENPDRQEIVKNPDTMLNYSRNAVEGQEVYNASKQYKSNWFFLDLETGSRGWYPGCQILGDILTTDVPLKADASDDSETLKTISMATVRILDIQNIKTIPSSGWYHIQYDISGYVKQSYIQNIRYGDPL